MWLTFPIIEFLTPYSLVLDIYILLSKDSHIKARSGSSLDDNFVLLAYFRYLLCKNNVWCLFAAEMIAIMISFFHKFSRQFITGIKDLT